MDKNRFCLMYDGIFYNLFPEAFGSTPIIIEADLGSKLTTFYDWDAAEAARLSAYARRVEYEENGLEIPRSFDLISELEIVPIDDEVWEKIDEMSFEV